MDFIVPFAFLVFSSAISAYDIVDDIAEDIPKPDSDGYTDSIKPQEVYSQSDFENPLQIALARIFAIKRRQNNVAAIKSVNNVTSTTESMKQPGNITTTNTHHVKINDIVNYGLSPGRLTDHDASKLFLVRRKDSFVKRPRSNDKKLKNQKFESGQQRVSNNTIGEIIKLGIHDSNTSSIRFKFKEPDKKNGPSDKIYLDDIFVRSFSNIANTKMPNQEVLWHHKNKTSQLNTMMLVGNKNLSALAHDNCDEFVTGCTTTKWTQSRRQAKNRSHILGLDVEIWRSERLLRKQEMAKKMLL